MIPHKAKRDVLAFGMVQYSLFVVETALHARRYLNTGLFIARGQKNERSVPFLFVTRRDLQHQSWSGSCFPSLEEASY